MGLMYRRDLAEVAAYPGLWRLARGNLRYGLTEVRRSLSRKLFAASLARLVPALTADDIVPAGAGVRAQAISPDGSLVDDFLIVAEGFDVPAGEVKGSWRDRKERYLRHLRELPPGDPALLVSCADKLHNAQAILADLEAIGPELWDRFPGRTPEDHLWYYWELAAAFEALLPGPLADRLRSTVEAIGDVHGRLAPPPAGPERGT